MRVAIVGSREFSPLTLVRTFVASLSRDDTVITGGARGVDEVAESTARSARISRWIFEPKAWDGAARSEYVAALFARNEEIVLAADVVHGFYDGASRGTRRVLNQAKRSGKPTFVHLADGTMTEWEGKGE